MKKSDLPEQIKVTVRGLGVFPHDGFSYLLFHSSRDDKYSFRLSKSEDGFGFSLDKKDLKIEKADNSFQDLTLTSEYEVNKIDSQFLMLYKHKISGSWGYAKARSEDLEKWKSEGMLPWMEVTGTIVPGFKHDGKYVMYAGHTSVHIAYSHDLEKWEFPKKAVLTSRHDKFDSGDIEVEHALETKRGILVLYHSKTEEENFNSYKVGAALFSKENPTHLLWRANEPLWDTKEQWGNHRIEPVGVIEKEGQLISYWNVDGEGIFAVLYSLYGYNDGLETRSVSLELKKAAHNPIISPNEENDWEAFTTFNPAAFYLDGKVHLLYRAQGFDYVSVIGYATSSNGMHIDERFSDPIYAPHEVFEVREEGKKVEKKFVSGGGYGGCEDPRVTQIGDKLYMTYVAFDGWSPPRVALTSISIEDFRNQRWMWERPVLISPPGVVNKNAVIFPEKVNGKYVVMHRVYPDILIDYVDDLNFDGETKWLEGHYKISPRKDKWDSRKIGAGPPPIKTKDGWLLIYQSVGNQDPGRYKIGAMLLDLNDPTKVLHRSDAPILEPVEHYENHGFKSGVAYPCGAVVLDGMLHVYYGGADSYVCVATVNLDEFLSELKYSEIAKLNNVIVQKIAE